ncbi:disintegrin and metalloproteinase domain-containing protein 25-like [Talpa occidentalis]|uniref:disintegrin and metalloproteinase domain-containing protein 25-like n=1 Tax=Talpa occidentalis TaxID=50954 RepID=UPI00188F3102|nr:disintegrin and metalloproteinase domain-containing protein 25-like [Talpa occidentalis]XP_037382355.1 disintegrin and metalloproteinase domain-containing protein 25-like [Talpa occidentalis]XP_037382356.1 disintegrin and metalloproteinase domain-containing protein 25-like [Talpa occidentalis]XP_054557024.1 disintegrin and metalloproteinase domain-containing protein 25-like [Talpa occidentalis]XP_054557025.1 disintegrin and metalloproteinase domain-containing protein 25-like [Talpa occidenta
MAGQEALVPVRLSLLLLWLRLFLSHWGWARMGHAQLHSPPEVVIPRRVTGPDRVVKPQDWLSYSLHFGGQRHIVHMRVQKHLLARHLPVFSYTDQGALIEDHPVVQNDCYYHGYVVGDPQSLVVLSTCFGGLRGILQINDTIYEIEPKEHSTTFEHLVYKLDSEETGLSMRCGLTDEEIARQLKFQEDSDPTLMQSGYEGWWTHQRVVELAVVVDHNRYLHKKSNVSKVYTEVSLVINYLHGFYIPLEVDIVLIGIEIWTESNPLPIDLIDPLLKAFCKWKKTGFEARLPHDVAHVFVKKQYGITLGLAYVASVCSTKYNCAILSAVYDDLYEFSYIMAHELGHNLGMMHDEPLCACGQEHCIMYPQKVKSTKFSNCSYADFWNYVGKTTCLRVPPEHDRRFRHSLCGNKVVEEGEECDCGSVTSCEDDPCCESNCTLSNGSACAFGLCCKFCKLKPSGTLCRERENECDLPEWCNGTSYLCPEDVYVQDGVPCSESGHCYEKRCNDRVEQCRQIFGKEAKNANHRCYSEVNTRGDRFGHCGWKGPAYVKCAIADVLCGRVQCDGVRELPLLSDHTTVHWAHFNGVTCWGTDYHFGMTIPDIGEVKDGTTCGVDRICLHRKCVPAALLTSRCSWDTCNRNGICNNKDHCHCDPEWKPPFCLRRGHGGSVDSGPPMPRNVTEEDSYVYLFLLWGLQLLLLLTVAIVLIWMRYVRDRQRTREH